MVDLNAQLGEDRRGFEEVPGKEGWEDRNVEVTRLQDSVKEITSRYVSSGTKRG